MCVCTILLLLIYINLPTNIGVTYFGQNNLTVFLKAAEYFLV